MSNLCEHDTFKDICAICHRDGLVARLEARVKELEAASLRVLEWAWPIAGDNRNDLEAREEVTSVEALRAALSQPAPNRETDWGPDVGNEILPPPPEKGE
jgi:hypothetical protein